MKKEKISFNETGLFSKLICDFVNRDLGVKPLISSFFNKESISSSFQKKSTKNRLILCSVLKEQYSHTSFMNPDLSHIYSNIDAISKHNTYTVTTGHQLNIFAGPLFLIYKILSVISYTNYLNQNINEYQFVPCFWMATEDHDLNEINNLNLYNKTYSSNLALKNCVGDLLSKPILKTLVTIKKLLNTSKYGEELYNIYEYAYKENLNYANATRSLLTTLFGDYGLVVIDGNNTHLKRIFIPDFEAELKDKFVYNNLLKSNKVIKQKYKPEINPMKSNIFYFTGSNRLKIQYDNKLYFLNGVDKEWSPDKLFNEINNYPNRFSPNVILRTLYQERIMPNIMYIGGPSEIAYWLQLKEMFDARKLEYPILNLRAHFLIFSKKTSLKQFKLGLKNEDIFLNYHSQLKKIINYNSSINIDNEIIQFNHLLSKMQDKFKSVDASPINSFHVFEKRFNNELHKLKLKMLKFEKIKHEYVLNELCKFNNQVFPNKLSQERGCAFIPYYIKYGKDFFNLLLKEISIFDNKYIILREEDSI